MKIIIFVDFASSEFNKDFVISNALTQEHTVLLVTSMEQLLAAKDSYDVVLIGNSINANTTEFVSIKNMSLQEITENILK